MSHWPRFFRVHQKFDAPVVNDVVRATIETLGTLDLRQRVKPGESVAITAGSRGIAHIAEILKAVVEHFKQLDTRPFIVPAMGSHGGGTAEGQLKVLRGYGITPEFCGCEIRASMETVVVSQAAEGFAVHFDKHAYGADHVFVAGRIKPHTRFAGEIESGLMKMMLIGLGKHEGAKIYHRAIVNHSFDQIVRSVAREVLDRCAVCGGLAILENAYDQTAKIEAVAPERFETREPELLIQAKRWLARLPFERADILFLDHIGKEISGAGMDTNVVGRKWNDHEALEHETPKVKRICVRGLSPATHGNAIGLGLAEFCLTRVIDAMDVNVTRINSLTGSHPTAGMIPFDYPNDAEMLEAAVQTVGLVEPESLRILWSQDTLHLGEIECSEAYWEQAQQRDDLEVLVSPRSLPLSESGLLPDFVELSPKSQ
ncbi:MAG: lactate racemase domain-containing protein [Planctomycetota bacterium]|nr:lactate racemase domain-containing protein [Planctomycetota bacterium]MEC8389799.1 lactate racemase domain-containing protein [Planctomycetota bacterium]